MKEISPPTLVAEDANLRGTLTFSGQVYVYGIVDGKIIQNSSAFLQVGHKGWIHGSVFSKGPIVIEGRVEGEMISECKIVLLPSSRVLGRLKAPSIEIHAGATFEGDVVMAPESFKALDSRLLKAA